jgi:hypothetical protein
MDSLAIYPISFIYVFLVQKGQWYVYNQNRGNLLEYRVGNELGFIYTGTQSNRLISTLPPNDFESALSSKTCLRFPLSVLYTINQLTQA